MGGYHAILKEIEVLSDEARHSARSLREYLVGVLVAEQHDFEDSAHEPIRNIDMEQIAHTIHEYPLPASPSRRLRQTLRPQAHCEWIAAIRRCVDLRSATGVVLSQQSTGQGHRVAIVATGAHLRAPGHGVPRDIRPLDSSAVRHRIEYTHRCVSRSSTHSKSR